MDVISKAERSRIMSRIRSAETGIEREFRRMLWSRGLRYRKNFKMEGTPDIAFPGVKLAVFLDSCFWHFCRYHCRMPKSNKSFWRRKLLRNRSRDRATTKRLRRRGWIVVRLWEHQLRANPASCITRISEALKRTKGTARQPLK